jgi:tetratricopeptide (TPR) repeat protein
VVLNGNSESEEMTRKAYTLRDRVSERERYYIVSHYQQFALGNLDAARATIEQWAATYPRDTDAPINLWRLYIGVGLNERAYSVIQEILRTNPSTPATNSMRLSTNLIALSRFKEARATLNDTVAHHIDQPGHHAYLYELDFLDGDAAAMAQEAAYLHGKTDWDDIMNDLESYSYAWRGQFAKARDLSERVVISYRRAKDDEGAAGAFAEAALEEAVAGNNKAARDDGTAALKISTGAETVEISAVALALAGDQPDANRAVDSLNKLYPEDTLAQMGVATVRSLGLLGNGCSPESARRAVDALAPIASYERAGRYFMVPVYARGLAYLAAGQPESARVEFQKILDNPGVTRNFVLGSVAHLALARAFAATGDKPKARAAVQDFLTLWKDADSDLPTLKDAKALLGSLGG